MAYPYHDARLTDFPDLPRYTRAHSSFFPLCQPVSFVAMGHYFSAQRHAACARTICTGHVEHFTRETSLTTSPSSKEAAGKWHHKND